MRTPRDQAQPLTSSPPSPPSHRSPFVKPPGREGRSGDDMRGVQGSFRARPAAWAGRPLRRGLASRGAAMLILLFTAAGALAQDPDLASRLRKARESWDRMDISSAAAEWRGVLEIDPNSAEARAALARLAPVFERTDAYLDVVESLVERGHAAEAEEALARQNAPFVSRDQQARVLILRGGLQLTSGNPRGALIAFASAELAAESAAVRLRARLGRGQALLARPESRPEAELLLRDLRAQAAGSAWEAEVDWAWNDARVLDDAGRILALREFLRGFPQSRRRVQAHRELAERLERVGGTPRQEGLEELLAGFRTGELAERIALGGEIEATVARVFDPATLSWLAQEFPRLPPAWEAPVPPAELAVLALQRAASLARGPAVLTAIQACREACRSLLERGPRDARFTRWREHEARTELMEGQALLLAGREVEALASVTRASELHSALVREGHRPSGEALLRIGRILEGRWRSDAAARHYREVAVAFVADPLGEEALWRRAAILRDRLDRPLEAIAVLTRYQDLYPPAFRIPTAAAERIRRLGYGSLSAFQAARGLEVDGTAGTETLGALREEEENFREVLPREVPAVAVPGRLVHDAMLGIARGLEERGRYREAVRAYESFLNLYPGHSKSEDALMAIAGIFHDNGLVPEAAAAFARVIEDYPNGDRTSRAYLEAARCAVSLGDWKKAEEDYALYAKKFPRYDAAAAARAHLESIRKVIRFADLLADALPAGKAAAALYETGRILYREMGHRRKAAWTFGAVADRYPESYQAPEARFSQGVCLLHEEDFPAARAAFEALLRERPESRLADDAQFWIGHTWEYEARALGRLDLRRVVLRRRSADEAGRLRRDLDLRRRFFPGAVAAAPAEPPEVVELLRAGESRERVREGLHRAVTAYRKTVDDHPLGDMAQRALLRVGAIFREYLDDPDRAIEAYRTLLEKYPGSPAAVDAQLAVGRHFLDQGDLAGAEKAIRQFLVAYPNHGRAGEAWLDLAECHRSQKEWQKALDDYESFLARYPDSERAASVREQIEWLKKYRFE